MGSSSVVPQEQPQHIKPALSLQSASGGSESSAAHSRSGSFGPFDGRASNPTSAGSQFSALSFAEQYGIGPTRHAGTGDPVSAVGSLYSNASESVGMERENSLHGLESFDKLSLDKARSADVEDLDDEGWRIVSMEKRIVELGSLGEGAGGAVTRCKLKGGNTVFALKVRALLTPLSITMSKLTYPKGHHNQPRPRRQTPNRPRARLQQGLHVGAHLQVLRRLC